MELGTIDEVILIPASGRAQTVRAGTVSRFGDSPKIPYNYYLN